MKIFLTKDRIQKTKDLAASVISHSHSRLSVLVTLLGLLVANMDVLHWGRLYFRELQWFLKPYQRHIVSKSDILLQVSLRIQNSLKWWMLTSNLNRGKRILLGHEGQLVTDVSLSGWGLLWHNNPVRGPRPGFRSICWR